MRKLSFFFLLLALTATGAFAAQEVKPLNDFETDEELKIWETDAGGTSLSDQHATHGKKSMKVEPGKAIKISRPQDWSGFESLEIDYFVDSDAPVKLDVIIFDKATEAKRSYWNWHNGFHTLSPGAGTISLPVEGFFRGEQGAANRDIKTNINPHDITVFHLGFTPKGKCGGIYLDNMRLTKETLPEGIQAFAFGPERQAAFPGFKPITWNTVYGQGGKTAGLKVSCGNANRARDDGFPTRLYQHFVWFQEGGNEFITDAPNGKCHVWMVFDDCGFWAGEQAHFHKRSIIANGKEAFVDNRGEAGPSDYLYRFENTEPKPGDSLWDLYIKELFKPARFEAEVTDGKLHIQCEADGYWNTKVAAIVVYPDAKKADGEAWLTELEARNKKEFEARAVYVGAKPKTLDVPADAKAKGYWLGFPAIEDSIISIDAPGKAEGQLKRGAVCGQRVGLTFAVRSLKDFDGSVSLIASDLKGPGTIPASAIDCRFVQQLTHRNSNETSYTIEPALLRKIAGSNLKLTKDFTRQFWITATVPADAKAGSYTGSVTLSAGSLKFSLPVSIDVVDFALDEPDFSFGFFGASVPAELPPARQKTAWLELLTLLKQYGMNSMSGGPGIPFSGFDSTGKPQLNFAACDEFFRTLKQAGFTKPIYTYGGPAYVEGLHDGYTIGATGHGWEKKTGKPFKEILQIVFGAVKEHAKQEGWPAINYSLLDEPTMLEGAQANLELHQAYHDAGIMYDGGFYSVNWEKHDPFDTTVQGIFKAMAWSGLNVHSQIDFDKAKELGRDIHVYNNGKSRFSFGAYQWAEMHKGAKGRLEWHTLNLAGYQFFDLDGQEPDYGFINWGRDEIIPTIGLARCGEGATDFRLAVTLWNAAEKKKGTPEAKAAQDYLEEVNKTVGAGKHQAPAGFSDETFRSTCIEHLKKLK